MIGRYRFSHALVADVLEASCPPHVGRGHTRAPPVRSSRCDSRRSNSTWRSSSTMPWRVRSRAPPSSRCSARPSPPIVPPRSARTRTRRCTVRPRCAHSSSLGRRTTGRGYDTLVLLGAARRQSDDAAGAISAFADAIAVAEQLGDVPRHGVGRRVVERADAVAVGDYGADNAVESAMVERVLDRISEDDSTVRAELMGVRSCRSSTTATPACCDQLSADAVAMARRLGDPATLLRTLNNRAQAHWRVGSIAQRTANVEEMLQLVVTHDLDPSLRFLAEFTRMVSGVELGEPPRPGSSTCGRSPWPAAPPPHPISSAGSRPGCCRSRPATPRPRRSEGPRTSATAAPAGGAPRSSTSGRS